ncbi:MAG: hypothetical protein AB8B50_18185 [Pirellulaceae bacterium]
MATKRKTTSPKKQRTAPSTTDLSVGQPGSEVPVPSNGPTQEDAVQHASATTRVLFSLAVVGHLALLYLALSSNLFQSRLQQAAMGWASSYSVTTGQQYGMVPLELTHAESFDLPLLIQTRKSSPPGQSSKWTTLDEFRTTNLPRWSNLSRSMRVIFEDDPENEILADFAFTIVRQLEAKDQESQADEIRFVQPFVPNFDEGSALADGLGGLLDTEPQVLYSATVVRDDQGRAVGLLPDQEDYRSSVATISNSSNTSSPSD